MQETICKKLLIHLLSQVQTQTTSCGRCNLRFTFSIVKYIYQKKKSQPGHGLFNKDKDKHLKI